MIRRLVCLVTIFGATNLYALTTPRLFVQGLPTTFIPGETFTAQVGLPPITDLGAYNVDLILTSDSGQAGTEFFFDLAATVPAPAGYVFPSTANFLDAVVVDSPTQHRIALSDFDLNGVDVVASFNDLIALLTIGTSTDFAGDLTLSFDVDGLLLDTPAITPTPVIEFPDVVAATVALNPFTIRRIPEPSSIILLALGTVAATSIFGIRKSQ